MNKKITAEEFQQRVKERHGENITFALEAFTAVSHPLTVFCKIHKARINVKKAYQVENSQPCKECLREEKFKSYTAKVHHALNDHYPHFSLLSTITDFNCEVELLCQQHGNFSVRADSIIYHRMNCPRCASIKVAKKLTGRSKVSFKEFKRRFDERYGSRLKLLSNEADYQNFNSTMYVTCSDPSHPAFEKSARDLLRYQGCKNCNESWGERLTRIALEDLGINYEQEKRFASCRDKKELPFDFWLPDFSTLVEFQGQQHELPAELFGGSKALSGTKKRDRIKREWAAKNGIHIIYLFDYQKIKQNILRNLTPSENYKPKEVLKNIDKSDAVWVEKKWGSYLRKLNQKHKGNLDFSDATWCWGQKHITYRCHWHGERTSNLQNLLKGHGCSICSGNEVTLENVIERSRKAFGDRFDFSKSIFVGMETEMQIICKAHGLISISPERHLRLANGCNLCSPKAENFSPAKFLDKATRKFGDRFDYTLLNYRSTASKITIKCRKHQLTFETLPGDHLRNKTGACPGCVKENKVQAKSKPILVEGIKYSSIKSAADAYGLQSTTVRARLKSGWDVDKAFTTPKR